MSIPQYTFDGCRNKKQLPFDFFLPDLNTVIEYQGKQHFEPIKYFGGDVQFEKRTINDNIKRNFCQDNNIPLLEIKYDENIEEVLVNHFPIPNMHQ